MGNVIFGYNDLLTQNPELAAEWHPTKNGELTPDCVAAYSNKKVWWLGKCGHEWDDTINHRSSGRGCPYCAGKRILKGSNDLETVNPALANEWNYAKNGDLKPDMVTKNCRRTVWWKCDKGHEWQSTIDNRSKGKGCPYCAGHIAIKGVNDLATVNPKLASEWHPTKNNDLFPEDVLPNSNKKVWWLGKCGHEWQAIIESRNAGNGCPYCSGKKVLKGFNDLASVNPALVNEWHPTKNDNLTPDMVTAGSSKKVWWQCEKKHEWQSTVVDRRNGNGCPFCSKEYQTSFPEQAMYYYIKQIFPDAINRETSFGKELDIFIPSIRLAIEYDGSYYHKNIKRDKEKTSLCNKNYIRLVRVREKECPSLDEPDIVIRNGQSEKSLEDALNELMYLLNIKDISIDIGRDRSEIYDSYIINKKNESLLEMNPKIAAEWHPTKNGGLTPSMVLKSSSINAWWVCKFGHEWKSSVNDRNNGRGCPYCAGKRILKGFNDLETINPNLANEWHSTKNGNLTPDMVTAGSHKKVWWQCHNGHEWQATIADRSKGRGCPYCAGQRTIKGENDLATVNPKLASEWHPIKNGNLKPDMVMAGSNKVVWWIGKCGHEYQASLYNRNNGRSCPYCAGKKVLKGFNDLNTINPELASEWHPAKNGGLTPETVTASSGKKVYWLGKCGHEWNDTINHRSSGRGCPYCSGHRILKGFNDLPTKNPKIASEWHTTKNGSLKPDMVMAGSDKKVWWQCSNGHVWQAIIANRSKGSGCPYCAHKSKK